MSDNLPRIEEFKNETDSDILIAAANAHDMPFGKFMGMIVDLQDNLSPEMKSFKREYWNDVQKGMEESDASSQRLKDTIERTDAIFEKSKKDLNIKLEEAKRRNQS